MILEQYVLLIMPCLGGEGLPLLTTLLGIILRGFLPAAHTGFALNVSQGRACNQNRFTLTGRAYFLNVNDRETATSL